MLKNVTVRLHYAFRKCNSFSFRHHFSHTFSFQHHWIFPSAILRVSVLSPWMTTIAFSYSTFLACFFTVWLRKDFGCVTGLGLILTDLVTLLPAILDPGWLVNVLTCLTCFVDCVAMSSNDRACDTQVLSAVSSLGLLKNGIIKPCRFVSLVLDRSSLTSQPEVRLESEVLEEQVALLREAYSRSCCGLTEFSILYSPSLFLFFGVFFNMTGTVS